MILFLSLLTLLLFAVHIQATPSPAASPVRPPPGTPTVGGIAVDAPDVDPEGSGCRPGTIGVIFARDNSFLTLLFDNFQAAVGPKAGDAKKRAFCRVNVTMASPGWAFDVSSVDFQSYVNVQKGVEVSLVTRWKWIDAKGVDMKGKGNVKKVIEGPFEDDFLLHKDGELSDSETSVCSKVNAKFQLSISATLSATSSSLTGLVQGSAADAAFGEILNLAWKKC